VAAVKGLGNDCKILLLKESLDGTETGKSLMSLVNLGKSYGQHRQTRAYEIPPGQTNKDICAFLNFSSGTTGLPKAVGAGSVANDTA
jgi:acyl-coenzyme A synthetase/AMP-(fatty) acid ligase